MNRPRQDAHSVDARFPRHSRLTKPPEYRFVFSKPIRSADRYFSVLVRTNGALPARLGLAISKKCARRALDRNRLKRLIRESFRHNRQLISGVDVIVMCRHGAVDATNANLVDSIRRHWDSIRDQLCASCSSP